MNERGGYRESERWCEWERVAGCEVAGSRVSLSVIWREGLERGERRMGGGRTASPTASLNWERSGQASELSAIHEGVSHVERRGRVRRLTFEDVHTEERITANMLPTHPRPVPIVQPL